MSKSETFLFCDHPRWETRAERIHAHYDEALSLYNRVLPKGMDIDSLTVPNVEIFARTVIAIESEPGEGLLFIDAKPQGRMPATVELEPGRHLLLIRKDGFARWTRDVELKPGESASVSATLKPIDEYASNPCNRLKGLVAGVCNAANVRRLPFRLELSATA